MSKQLARRTGTVSALVAAASMTMVAGVWPALGVASAAELPPGGGASAGSGPPGQAKQDAVVTDTPVPAQPMADTAPGQEKKEPAPVEAAPVADAVPGQEKKELKAEP
ncbi:MAG: hypothetical protein WD794_14550, partial [Mycobacteriales bacterium]